MTTTWIVKPSEENPDTCYVTEETTLQQPWIFQYYVMSQVELSHTQLLNKAKSTIIRLSLGGFTPPRSTTWMIIIVHGSTLLVIIIVKVREWANKYLGGFKSGDKHTISHYQPISLLSLIGNLIEKLFHYRVYRLLNPVKVVLLVHKFHTITGMLGYINT